MNQTAKDWPYRLVELTPNDAARILTLEDAVWFEITPGASADQIMEVFDYSASKGVETKDDGQAIPGISHGSAPLVGIYGAYAMHLTIPGAGGSLSRVPMSGLTWVGVHPDHRRRRILSAMMTDHLHGLYQRGDVSVAGLWAAEVGIYGRYGYGPASLEVMLTVDGELTPPEHVTAAAKGIQTHMVPAHTAEAGALIQDLHVASAARTLGTATRPDSIAQSWFRDFSKARGDKEPRQVLFATRDGEPLGYALVRRKSDWDDYNNPSGEMTVGEVGAVDSATLLALAKRLLDFDLIDKVKFYSRSTDDPLVWWAGGPRSTTMKVTDALWLRLVDLQKAMSGRGYAAPCDMVIEVTDDVCPWNARCWRLVVNNQGVGTCDPSDAEADLSMGVQVLGSAYLGGRSISSQAAAGLVQQHRDGAVRELSRSMRADTEPYGTSGF